MNLGALMDDLGDALATLDGLRVSPYWADRIHPPAAVVGWPEPLTYDAAMARGADRLELPVIVLTGRVDQRTARDQLARYVDGSGPASVKAAIETHQPSAYHSARVLRAEFSVITVAAVEYLAATFTVEIIGSGA